jgi:hypothetical protein
VAVYINKYGKYERLIKKVLCSEKKEEENGSISEEKDSCIFKV